MKKSKDLKACRQAISRARADQSLYQKAADNAPDETVRSWNQKRADSARDSADTYERWAAENR